MVRVNRSELTKLEIIRYASRKILENGYSNTQVRAIAKELNMSPGNLTFHYRTKEELLAELVRLLCDFQWKMMELEADEGFSSIMAICLELTAMAAMCDENEIAKDFYLSTYCSSLSLDIIRRNDAARAKEVFREYCPNWTDEQFAEAEVLVSGIEYGTLVTAGAPISLETRIAGALNHILSIYQIPEEIRKMKIGKVLAMDYRGIGRRVFQGLKRYIEETNEHALMDLLKG